MVECGRVDINTFYVNPTAILVLFNASHIWLKGWLGFENGISVQGTHSWFGMGTLPIRADGPRCQVLRKNLAQLPDVLNVGLDFISVGYQAPSNLASLRQQLFHTYLKLLSISEVK